MDYQDIRWKQRFANYQKALNRLREVAANTLSEELSELEKEGLIQRFEYSYELAWKTLQDYLKEIGYSEVAGPGKVISQAFEDGIIKDGEGWRRMKQSRELTSHTYNEDTAKYIVEDILASFYELLDDLEKFFKDQLNEDQTGLF